MWAGHVLDLPRLPVRCGACGGQVQAASPVLRVVDLVGLGRAAQQRLLGRAAMLLQVEGASLGPLDIVCVGCCLVCGAQTEVVVEQRNSYGLPAPNASPTGTGFYLVPAGALRTDGGRLLRAVFMRILPAQGDERPVSTAQAVAAVAEQLGLAEPEVVQGLTAEEYQTLLQVVQAEDAELAAVAERHRRLLLGGEETALH